MKTSSKKLDIRNDAICHDCKDPISYDTAQKSSDWAFGMPGVRWLICYKCAKAEAK